MSCGSFIDWQLDVGGLSFSFFFGCTISPSGRADGMVVFQFPYALLPAGDKAPTRHMILNYLYRRDDEHDTVCALACYGLTLSLPTYIINGIDMTCTNASALLDSGNKVKVGQHPQ